MKRLFFMSGVALFVAGCSHNQSVWNNNASSNSPSRGNMTQAEYDKATGGGRYTQLQDTAPTDTVNTELLPELVPKWEPKSRGGNKSTYEVWGKTYKVMDSAKGFVQTGTASWYGKKFHGHTTSNGETYDMYNYSAAHKNLPLPTYLKVTNLDNDKSVIVRVNDRGPFHSKRIIDLSYAAAVKLDYHTKGLARVKIEAITPAKGSVYQAPVVKTQVVTPVAVAPVVVPASVPVAAKMDFTHLQMGAYSKVASAEALKQRLLEEFDTSISVFISEQTGSLFKVMVGPFANAQDMNLWSNKLLEQGFSKPVRVNLTP
ncbi:putative rare lipoprotein A [Marinomonas sp. MED121]|uniref:septal ring lytic transglycosylase RlpA family protein n=1 Tax=Marinomonas sp. MED121 TaxID=314277 RepID=UPI000068FF42|nr:septal ring lytic transglycosylase RlpA family protein [Marinomonas sp. MED121]EAQ66917.1 putative rare lipoprotein A [Marinomonas sp. MED121]